MLSNCSSKLISLSVPTKSPSLMVENMAQAGKSSVRLCPQSSSEGEGSCERRIAISIFWDCRSIVAGQGGVRLSVFSPSHFELDETVRERDVLVQRGPAGKAAKAACTTASSRDRPTRRKASFPRQDIPCRDILDSGWRFGICGAWCPRHRFERCRQDCARPICHRRALP